MLIKLLICIAIVLLVAVIVGSCAWALEMKHWPRYEDRHEPDDDYCKDMDAK